MNSGLAQRRSYDSRGKHRIDIKAPVRFGRAAMGATEAAFASEGQSANLSTGGIYLTTNARGPFAAGDVIRVSIEIPREARRLFPFSRILGSCRVVRVDLLADSEEGTPQVGLALEFLGQNTTLLGAIVA